MRRLISLVTFCIMSVCIVQAQDHRVDSIMERVFNFVGNDTLVAKDFSSDIYLKYMLETHRKGVLMRYIPGMFPLERGTNFYFGESRDHYQAHDHGSMDRKNIAYHGTFRHFEKFRNNAMGRLNLSIYEPSLFSDRILSPLHRRNRRCYRYKYLYAYTADGEVYTRIQIEPRFHNVQLVSGTTDINNRTGAVREFSFNLRYEFSKLTLSGWPGQEGNTVFFPEHLHLKSRTSLLGNVVEGYCEAYAQYNFTEKVDTAAERKKRDLTNLCGLKTDTTQTKWGKAYFDSLRPVPLTEKENKALLWKDSVRKVSAYIPERKRRWRFSPEAEDILLDSHRFPLGTKGRLKLPALLTPSMVQWSKSKGFTLQTKFALDYKWSHGRSADISPRAAYNFKQQRFYWRVPIKFRLIPVYDGTISVETGNGNRVYSSKQAEEVRRKLSEATHYDSLIHIFNNYGFQYYKDFYCLGDFSVRPVPGVQFGAGIRYHRRSLVGWNEVAEGSGMLRYIHSLAPRLHLEFTPGQYYYRDGRRKIPLYSKFPTFMLDYERGIKVGSGRSNYERWEADIKWVKELYALRSLYFRLGAGLYTDRGDNYFLDYDYFRDNNMPEGWDDELSGQFHLLNAHWYNESDFYVRGSVAYESPMLLLSRLRWISRIVQKERIYGSLLSVRYLTPYSEFGYGFSTYFVDVAAFLGLAGKQQTSFGCKFVLHW